MWATMCDAVYWITFSNGTVKVELIDDIEQSDDGLPALLWVGSHKLGPRLSVSAIGKS